MEIIMKLKVAAVALAHPFEVGYDEAMPLLNKTAITLEENGILCENTGVVMHNLDTVRQAADKLKASDADVLMICIATWSEDHHLLDLLSYVDMPLILRAYPAFDTGSLCCAHQIGAVFRDIGKTCEFVYGDADDVTCVEEVKNLTTAYALKNCMSKVRVGAIGGRVKGMTEIAYDEFAIKQKLGARVVNIDEKEMTQKVMEMSDADAEKLLKEKQDVLAPCKILSDKSSMLESMKYYSAMKALADEYELDALSVKCYTTYMGKICLGYSLLAEEGVCTRFLVKPGTVTAVNICGHGDDLRLSVMVGEAVPCGMEFPGNPVKIKFEKPVSQMNREIMENGIGHHWMVAYGDYREELKCFCKINNIRMYEI